METYVIRRVREEGYKCSRIFKGIYLVKTGSSKAKRKASYRIIFTKR